MRRAGARTGPKKSAVLVTWNMKGGPAPAEEKWQCVAALLAGSNPGGPVDICCLQGCGELPEAAVQYQDYGDDLLLLKWRTGKNAAPVYILALTRWADETGIQCAIVSRDQPEIPRLIQLKPEAGRRPALGALLKDHWVYTFEAIGPNDVESGTPTVGADIAPMLTAVAKDAAGTAVWLVAGSFYLPARQPFPQGDWIMTPPGPRDAPAPTYPLLPDPPAYPDPTKVKPAAADCLVKGPNDGRPLRSWVTAAPPLSSHLSVAFAFDYQS